MMTAKTHPLADVELIKTINRALMVSFVLLSFYFLYEIFFVKPYQLVQVPAQENSAPPIKSKIKNHLADGINQGSYLDHISSRQIFSQPADTNTPGVSVMDEASNSLSLVGIVAGKVPQAIIENQKTQKTYYLNKGDFLNGFLVAEISGNQVILDANGKKLTLSL